jgi:uncharacterized protein (TIGR02118 family)
MSHADLASQTFTKRISLLTRNPGMSREEFLAHWRDHEALALAVPGLRRFVLNHIEDQPTRRDVTTLDIAEIDGIAESWWDDRSANEHAYTTPEGRRWLAHGASFIGAIKTYVVTETVVIG